MLKNIPPSRLLLYILLLGLIPIAFAAFKVQSHYNSLAEARSQLENIQYSVLQHEKKQSSNTAIIAHYREGDHFYIDKNLEALTLLEPEISALQKVTQTSNYAGDEAIEKRLEILQSDNQILFTEGPVQSNAVYQETIETLTKPIEVDALDLQRLLERIENLPITVSIEEKRPQLIILDLRLDRKAPTPNHETFLLNLKLLKREYL